MSALLILDFKHPFFMGIQETEMSLQRLLPDFVSQKNCSDVIQGWSQMLQMYIIGENTVKCRSYDFHCLENSEVNHLFSHLNTSIGANTCSYIFIMRRHFSFEPNNCFQ